MYSTFANQLSYAGNVFSFYNYQKHLTCNDFSFCKPTAIYKKMVLALANLLHYTRDVQYVLRNIFFFITSRRFSTVNFF